MISLSNRGQKTDGLSIVQTLSNTMRVLTARRFMKESGKTEDSPKIPSGKSVKEPNARDGIRITRSEPRAGEYIFHFAGFQIKDSLPGCPLE